LIDHLGDSINEDGDVVDLNLTPHLVKPFIHAELFPYLKIFCHLCGELEPQVYKNFIQNQLEIIFTHDMTHTL
jgi:hypothetical protein